MDDPRDNTAITGNDNTATALASTRNSDLATTNAVKSDVITSTDSTTLSTRNSDITGSTSTTNFRLDYHLNPSGMQDSSMMRTKLDSVDHFVESLIGNPQLW